MNSRRCVINGETISGCQAHDPIDRINDYREEGGRVDQYRLSEVFKLDILDTVSLNNNLIHLFVKHKVQYDKGHVMLAGTRAFKLSRLFPRQQYDTVFCSELVSGVLQSVGAMNHVNATKYSPGSLMRTLFRKGTYQLVDSFGGKEVS